MIRHRVSGAVATEARFPLASLVGLLSLLLPVVCCGQHSGSAAQYPQRPIRMIVPYLPGGSTDILTRIVSLKLAGNLNQYDPGMVRISEVQARLTELWHGGNRQCGASCSRVIQNHVGGEYRARAVQGHRAGHDRFDRRADSDDVRRYSFIVAARQGGQNQGVGGHQLAAGAQTARNCRLLLKRYCPVMRRVNGLA